MLTEKQLKERERRIGSSEIAAFAGIDPDRTAFQVLSRKIGTSQIRESSPAMSLGNHLEPWILEQVADLLEVETLPGESVVHRRDDWWIATPDALVKGEGAVIEAKSVGRHRSNPWQRNPDGQIGGEQGIPPKVLCQVQWQLGALDFGHGYVAALLDGTPPVQVYRVERSEPLLTKLRAVGYGFYINFIAERRMPDLETAERMDLDKAAEILGEIYLGHIPGLMRPLTEQIEQIAQRLAICRRWSKEVEEAMQRDEALLKIAIGEAEGIEGVATWKAPHGERRQYKEIAADLAKLAPAEQVKEIYARHSKPQSRRFYFTYKGEINERGTDQIRGELAAVNQPGEGSQRDQGTGAGE